MGMFLSRLADAVALVRVWRRPLASVTIALVVALSAGPALPSGAASLAQPSWSQLRPATSPPVRYLAGMADDPATSQLILFGGNGAGISYLSDTWTWTGTTWTKLSPATSPSARFGAVMAYDSTTSQLILFGGLGATGLALGDTWTWNGSTWSQLMPATSPPGRLNAVMAYDPTSRQLLLFGGDNAGFLGDTWTWSGTTWTKLSLATSPPGRQWAVMANDPATRQLLLFGGLGATGLLADTWALQLAPTITSGSGATFTVGTAGTFTVTTTSAPIPSLSATGALPTGVTFVDNHNGTATISGTPPAGTAGVYALAIKASNGVSPDASQSFTLMVNQPPVFRIYLPFVPE